MPLTRPCCWAVEGEAEAGRSSWRCPRSPERERGPLSLQGQRARQEERGRWLLQRRQEGGANPRYVQCPSRRGGGGRGEACVCAPSPFCPRPSPPTLCAPPASSHISVSPLLFLSGLLRAPSPSPCCPPALSLRASLSPPPPAPYILGLLRACGQRGRRCLCALHVPRVLRGVPEDLGGHLRGAGQQCKVWGSTAVWGQYSRAVRRDGSRRVETVQCRADVGRYGAVLIIGSVPEGGGGRRSLSG